MATLGFLFGLQGIVEDIGAAEEVDSSDNRGVEYPTVHQDAE